MITARHAATNARMSKRLVTRPSSSRWLSLSKPPGALGSVQAELVALDIGHHDVAGIERRLRFVALQSRRAELDQSVGLCLQRGHAFVTNQSRRGPHVEV